jgi:hypothetical protein
MTEPAPANADEARVAPYAPHALGLDGSSATLARQQRHWRETFAAEVYGPIPPPPDSLAVERHPMAAEGWQRLSLRLGCGPRSYAVDAALWLPPGATGAVPLIVGLCFLGPAGVLFDQGFPIDRGALVEAAPELGLVDRRLDEHVRGVHAARWPLPLILGAGFGLLLSCYGSWVPDCPERWQGRGLWPLLAPADGDGRPGALSLWAWAYRRLVDTALGLDAVDPARIALAGHSRLGKAALWAAANDERVAAVFVNNAGCLAPALSCREFGEMPAHLVARFPHWVSPRLAATVGGGALPPIDQHALVAACAPRRVYIASASDDWWADPRGEYEGLAAALPAWAATSPGMALSPWSEVARPGAALTAGPLGWHLRPGGHGLTPWDWRRTLAFLARG